MRLHNFINELGFNAGRDVDFPTGRYTVLSFDADDRYRLEGQTHEIVSHAIKHLGEFKPSEVKSVLNKIKTYVLQHIDQAYLLNSVSQIIMKGSEIPSNMITEYVLLNMLDLLNDKKLQGKKLNDIEDKLVSHLAWFKAQYETLIVHVQMTRVKATIENIENLIRERRIVTFKDMQNAQVTMNFKDYSLLIERNGKPNTYYVVKSTVGSAKKLIDKVINIMGLRPLDPNLERVFMEIKY